jgi:hypothetical protein
MIRHNDERSKAIMAQFLAAKQRLDHQRCNVFSLEMQWTGMCSVEKTIDARKSLAIGDLAGGRKMGTGQAAMQVPGQEQPAVIRIDVGQAALGRHWLSSGLVKVKLWRSHECERGTQECVRHGCYD